MNLRGRKGRHLGLFFARMRRPHCIAGDTDDAPVFTQEVEPLSGLFGHADYALGQFHLSCVIKHISSGHSLISKWFDDNR